MESTPNPAPGFVKHPGHTITTEPLDGKVTVRANGTVLATSKAALLLYEGNYPPVIYIPFSDIDFSKLEKTGSSTYCPFKGDASYWNIRETAQSDAMWAYEHPFDEMLQITNHGAFYPNKVEIEI